MGSDLYHGEYPVDMTPDEARAELERREPKHSPAEQQRLNDRVEAQARRVMGSENNMVAVPEGMVAWHGGDSAPADWDDSKPVRLRDGRDWDWRKDGLGQELIWGRPHADRGSPWDHGDIIAYTPARLASPQPDAQQGAVERLRAMSDAATPGPWAWEQCGDKEDAPVVGIVMDRDDTPLGGQFVQPIDSDDADYYRSSIARDWFPEDGCSASSNAAFAVACVNYVRSMLLNAATPSSPALDAATIERCIHVLRGNLLVGPFPEARMQRDADIAILETML